MQQLTNKCVESNDNFYLLILIKVFPVSIFFVAVICTALSQSLFFNGVQFLLMSALAIQMNLLKFTEECVSLLELKIQITLRRGCSPVNLLHIFRTPFLKNTLGGCFWK